MSTVCMKYAFAADVNSREQTKKKVENKPGRYLRLPPRFPYARLRSVATKKSKPASAKSASAKPAGDATAHAARKPMSLKKLAELLDLSPATVSLVINRS